MAKIYTIKSEDKAAFLNRLKSLNIPVSNSTVKNNKLEGTFTVTVSNPTVERAIDSILKQSPRIDVTNSGNK